MAPILTHPWGYPLPTASPPPGPTARGAHAEGAHRGTCPHRALAYRQGLGEAASSVSKRAAGTGPQYGPTPEPSVPWRELVLSAMCQELSSLLFPGPRPDPGRPHTADDPQKTPSEARSPSGRPPFWSRVLCSLSMLSGRRSNVSREGSSQFLPNLEGEFEGRSVLPGADTRETEDKLDVLITASRPHKLVWPSGKWTTYQCQQRGTAQQ